MENKKTAFVLVVFAVVMFVIVTFFAFHKVTNDKSAQKTQFVDEVTGELPELICEYADDQEAYKDAIISKNVSQCECIEDDKLKDTCKSASMDVMFYDRALVQFDATLCERINSEIQRNACEKVVASSISQLEENNPQYLADMYAAAHNENAIGQLEKVVKGDQKNIDNFISLALAYAEKGLKEQEQGRDQASYVAKAFEAIENAKAIDKERSEVYRAEAYVNEIKPDYNAALVSYSKAIELDENNVLAYAGRGHVYRMMGILEGAVSDFEKAAELDVNRSNVFIYTNLCNLEYSRSNTEEAVKNCKIVIAKENADPVFQSEAAQILGMLYMGEENYVQANSSLLTAKTLTPNDPNLYVTFSKLGIFEGDYVGSEADARKAIELSPTKAMSYLALSHALYMQERYDESIVAAEKGITLVADDVSLLTPSKPAVERDLNYSIANSYRHLGNVERQAEYEQKGKDVFEGEAHLMLNE